MKILFLILVSLLSNLYVFSQNGRPRISNDSIAVWEVRKISHPLSLTEEQRKSVLGSITRNLYDLDNIKKYNLSDSNRITAIKESRKRMVKEMKEMLTKEQFEKYKLLQKENRSAFVQRQNRNKVKVKSLEIEE